MQTPTSHNHNLLIVSDLHLGEDLKPATKTGYLRHVVLLERELEQFLTHYTKTRLDGRPWRLIVNGDMVDFLSVCLLPQEGEKVEEEEDKVYGLGNRPQAAVDKMKSVFARHPGVFKALAGFIGAGNQLNIVVGNHDVEFHWPAVQETFKQGVARIWAGSRGGLRPGALSTAQVEESITFHPWFFFQENVVWVEHGHQYDDYCSFDYMLNPMAPDKEEVLLNIGAAGARYLSNHIEGLDPHQQEDWNMAGYVRWSVDQGVRGLLRIYRSYMAFCMRMISLWRAFSKKPEQLEARRRTHRERLREVAAKAKLSEETLLAVDDLRRRPVMMNFFKLMLALMLDRLLIGATAMLLILVFVVALPWTWAAAAVLGTIIGAGLLSSWMSRSREEVDASPKMRAVTQRIRSLVHTPYVVFGHTHYPQAVQLEDGGMYFNTGTWAATEKPGILNAFTHVLIRHDKTGPKASLCQWRDGKSTAFAPPARSH
jgi:UDP-2,3-diacylglucosamine pyrophosphatase LpxH